jgi:hypothetical protein
MSGALGVGIAIFALTLNSYLVGGYRVHITRGKGTINLFSFQLYAGSVC